MTSPRPFCNAIAVLGQEADSAPILTPTPSPEDRATPQTLTAENQSMLRGFQEDLRRRGHLTVADPLHDDRLTEVIPNPLDPETPLIRVSENGMDEWYPITLEHALINHQRAWEILQSPNGESHWLPG